MFLKKKRNGIIKGRGCAGCRPQILYIQRGPLRHALSQPSSPQEWKYTKNKMYHVLIFLELL